MKGIIFNLLEQFVCEGWGIEIYERVLDSAELRTSEPFVGPGTYPDADLDEIVKRTAAILGLPVPNALRAFGRFAFPRLAARFPRFLQGHDTPQSFLLSIDKIHHVEVRKLYPKAITPTFSLERLDSERFLLRYTSHRHLCPLVEGLVAGVAEHYHAPIECRQTVCANHGADECLFELRFARKPLVVS